VAKALDCSSFEEVFKYSATKVLGYGLGHGVMGKEEERDGHKEGE
jgi:hypothetical protein